MDIRKNQQQTRSLFSSTAVSNTSLSPSCGSDLLWIQEQTHCLESPFPDDPLCKLNLMETSDFVKSLPLHNISPARTHNIRSNSRSCTVVDTPPYTPGRPIFGFTAAAANFGNFPPRKSIPSKWEDAGKWISSSSPSHHKIIMKQPPQQQEQSIVFSDKSRVTTEETLEGSSFSLFRPLGIGDSASAQELLTGFILV